MEKISFDLFDRGDCEEWTSIINKFKNIVREIKDSAGIFIEAAFQTLRSASCAFHLVENFKNLACEFDSFIHCM